MKIYIMRHGEASIAGPDTTRALTPKGKQDVARIVKFLQGAKVPVTAVWHSSKTRAFQTAQVFSQGFGNNLPTEPHSGLNPDDSVEDFLRDLEDDAKDGLLIVGHLPFVDQLVGRLTTDGKGLPIHFQTGTLAALEGDFHSSFTLSWVIKPELLPG